MHVYGIAPVLTMSDEQESTDDARTGLMDAEAGRLMPTQMGEELAGHAWQPKLMSSKENRASEMKMSR